MKHHCPFCKLPYENGLCVNPDCLIDGNPKPLPSADWRNAHGKDKKGKAQVFNSKEDMDWLKDVHIHDMPANAKSALIIGNEDWPLRIDVYDTVNPMMYDTPIMSLSEGEISKRITQPKRRN